MATSKALEHKITNVPIFNIALGLNDFEGGKRAIGRGWPCHGLPALKSLHPAPGTLIVITLYYSYLLYCFLRQDTSNLIARCGEWDTQTEREPMPFQDRKVFFLSDRDYCIINHCFYQYSELSNSISRHRHLSKLSASSPSSKQKF
jgi:hypothetical protein